MAEKTVVLFFEVLARNPRARKLRDEVFSNKCSSDECKRCVESRISYWYYKWLFGMMPDPVKAAEHIHECINTE